MQTRLPAPHPSLVLGSCPPKGGLVVPLWPRDRLPSCMGPPLKKALHVESQVWAETRLQGALGSLKTTLPSGPGLSRPRTTPGWRQQASKQQRVQGGRGARGNRPGGPHPPTPAALLHTHTTKDLWSLLQVRITELQTSSPQKHPFFGVSGVGPSAPSP